MALLIVGCASRPLPTREEARAPVIDAARVIVETSDAYEGQFLDVSGAYRWCWPDRSPPCDVADWQTVWLGAGAYPNFEWEEDQLLENQTLWILTDKEIGLIYYDVVSATYNEAEGYVIKLSDIDGFHYGEVSKTRPTRGRNWTSPCSILRRPQLAIEFGERAAFIGWVYDYEYESENLAVDIYAEVGKSRPNNVSAGEVISAFLMERTEADGWFYPCGSGPVRYSEVVK